MHDQAVIDAANERGVTTVFSGCGTSGIDFLASVHKKYAINPPWKELKKLFHSKHCWRRLRAVSRWPLNGLLRLVQDGWLRRIGHGVYGLLGDTLERDASLVHLGMAIPGLHVGAKTALSWRGIRHNLSARETISLWGEKSARLPAWFVEQFPAHYQATHLFDAKTPVDLGVAPLPAGRSDLLVSTPERAILELLSEIGKRQTLEEAKHLVEGARALRLNVLDYVLADDLDLPWQALALKHSVRLGGGERWVTLGRTGERLTLRKSK